MGVVRNSRLKRDYPFPLYLLDRRSISGAPKCIEAVHEGDADVDFDGLAIRVPRHDAFAEDFETAHPRLYPTSSVVSGPALPECPA